MISVVLVNWNGSADTISCVQGLLASNVVAARVIIVDNDSADKSLFDLQRWTHEAPDVDGRRIDVRFGKYVEAEGRFDGVESGQAGAGNEILPVYVVASGRNGGFGFGCNVGMRLADRLGTDSYWLLNNDCVPDIDAMRSLSEAVALRPDTIFGAIVRYSSAPYAVQAYGGGTLSLYTGKGSLNTHWPPRRRLNYIYGASMCFSARLRAAVGDFDENIFMYYEEIDFCLRAAQSGMHCGLVETTVFHKQGGSQGGVTAGAWTNVLLNKYYVLCKHFGFGSWTIVFFVTLLMRCVWPVGGSSARLGARRALRVMLSRVGAR